MQKLKTGVKCTYFSTLFIDSDTSLTTSTKKEVGDIKERLDKMTEKNKMLKEQCQHVTSQLDIALIQVCTPRYLSF